MDTTQIQRIEESFRALAPRGPELVDRFYALLFSRFPAVRPLFPQQMQAQKDKLLASIGLVVKSLRNPDGLKQTLLGLGARHAQYGTQEAHYPAVRDTLLDVMSEMAGNLWTTQLNQDWTDALNWVANVMIEGQRAATAQPAKN